MEPLLERLETLEHQMQTVTHRAHTAERWLRWWRRLACGLLGLGLLAWGLPVVTADDAKEP
jgi:hypothetical protein